MQHDSMELNPNFFFLKKKNSSHLKYEGKVFLKKNCVASWVGNSVQLLIFT